MKSRVGLIGLEPEELESVRSLLQLLRHPDPVVGELSRQALAYLAVVGAQSAVTTPQKPVLQ